MTHKTRPEVKLAKQRLAVSIEGVAETLFDCNCYHTETTSGCTMLEIRCTDGIMLNVTITEKRGS